MKVQRVASEPQAVVAANLSADAALLGDLRSVPDAYVWEAISIAENEETSHDILWEFAHHRQPGIRHAVARNQGTPSDLLEFLAWDKDRMIKIAVIMNPSASDQVKRLLATDLHPMTKTIAATYLSFGHNNGLRVPPRKMMNLLPTPTD